MVNIELLKQKIADSHFSMTHIAKASNIKRETLYNRLNGIGEFTASEISGMTKALGLTKKDRDDIFLLNG